MHHKSWVLGPTRQVNRLKKNRRETRPYSIWNTLISYTYNLAHTHIYSRGCAMNQLYKNTGSYDHWVDWGSWYVALMRMLSECAFRLSWRVCWVLTRYENLLITLSPKRIVCLTGLRSVIFLSWTRWWMMTRLINYCVIRKWNDSSGDWIQWKSRHKHNQE
jgi:hypothetical protein